jgi:DNA-binding GntR family transcriptional regulator
MPRVPKVAKPASLPTTSRVGSRRRPLRGEPVTPLPPPVARAPLQRQTVASMTVTMLREGIIRGSYPEGEPLRQDTIADELGVSRIPVREALRQLEAEGLVTFNPHRGAVVSSLSLAEIEEVFSLRADIECELLRRAIPGLTDEHLRRSTAILDSYERMLREGEVATWGELNWQFHSSLYEPAERPVTMGVVQRLHQQSDRYSRMQLALTHGELRANDEHRAIVAAIKRGDAKRATTLMKQHILGAGRTLVDFLRAQRHAREEAQVGQRGARSRS